MYPFREIGATNIFLKLWDHTFQRAPTDIEYWVIRIISHSSIPKSRNLAAVSLTLSVKNVVTKPKAITNTNEKKNKSIITSKLLLVIYSSCSNIPFILLID